MNYKFSNREKILLKILGALSVIFSVYFIEMKMLSGLTDSRDALRSKVQNFNATKLLYILHMKIFLLKYRYYV